MQSDISPFGLRGCLIDAPEFGQQPQCRGGSVQERGCHAAGEPAAAFDQVGDRCGCRLPNLRKRGGSSQCRVGSTEPVNE